MSNHLLFAAILFSLLPFSAVTAQAHVTGNHVSYQQQQYRRDRYNLCVNEMKRLRHPHSKNEWQNIYGRCSRQASAHR